MNKIDHQLNRLLYAAAQTAPEPLAALSSQTEKKILAGWKSSLLDPEEICIADFFMPALAVGLVAVGLSLLITPWMPTLNVAADYGLPGGSLTHLFNL